MKSAESVLLGGLLCLALTCATDTSHARSVHFLAVFPATEGPGVVLDFFLGIGAGAVPSPAEVLSLERFGDLLRSIRVHFESAPASIGVATMEKDGTIVLQLRAEGGGALGDALLRYPIDHARYAEILRHLGGLEPGQSKPLRFPLRPSW
jgi:hypothetical protein